MLARVGGTVDSIMALVDQRRATDAAVLLRTMFECTVTLAWIGIDPSEHAQRWLRWDRMQRIKADNDLQQQGVEPILAERTRQDFQAIVDAGPAMPDSLTQRAEEADRFWGARLENIDSTPSGARSLRFLYRYIYRRDSQHTHAAVASIEPVIAGSPPGPFLVLDQETDPGEFNAFTMTPVIYGDALLVAGPMLGIRDMREAVDAIFTRHQHG